MKTRSWETDELISTMLTQLNNNGCSLSLVDNVEQRDEILRAFAEECMLKQHLADINIIHNNNKDIPEYPAIVCATMSSGIMRSEDGVPFTVCLVRVFPIDYAGMLFDRLEEAGVLECSSGSNDCDGHSSMPS